MAIKKILLLLLLQAFVCCDIAKQHKVLKYSKPLVLVQTFAESAVNLRVLYWTSDHENS